MKRSMRGYLKVPVLEGILDKGMAGNTARSEHEALRAGLGCPVKRFHKHAGRLDKKHRAISRSLPMPVVSQSVRSVGVLGFRHTAKNDVTHDTRLVASMQVRRLSFFGEVLVAALPSC